MLSLGTERKLAEIFLSVSQCEHQVEECRHYLSNNYDFDPYSAFKFMDRLCIGSISSTEVQLLLDKHHIFCHSDEAYLVIRQYDSNLDGRLSIEEFFQLVLPSTNPGLKNLTLSRRGVITSEVEYLLVRLLLAEVVFHRNLETIKKELHLKLDFSISEAFRTIDIRNVSFINRETLTSFLRRHRNIGDEDVDAIFRRVDNDADEIINYQEFVDCILPTQPIASRSYRNFSPGISLTDRNGLQVSDGNSHSFRNSSPLRMKTPQKHTISSSSLKNQTKNQSSLKYLQSSTFQNSTFSSTMKSASALSPRKCSPLRNSSGKNILRKTENTVRKSNPLRSSNSKSLRGSNLQKALPSRSLREKTVQASSSRTFAAENPATSYPRNFTNTTSALNSSRSNFSNGNRKSSPLRRSSPERSGLGEPQFSSISKSCILNSNRSLRLQTPFEEKELVAWLQEEIKISRDVERKKNELALKRDFNLVDAFRLFDKNDLGAINLTDIEDTLGFFSFYSPRDEIYLLVKHFSHFQNNRLQFADFSEIFSPKQDEYARILRNRSAINLVGPGRMQVFSRDTQALFFDTLRLILDAESLAERVRQRLSRMPKFNLHQAFIAVDNNRNGFITIDEFQGILCSHGIFANSKDLQSLMHKYDKNKDGRVSSSEFIEEVTHKSPRRFN